MVTKVAVRCENCDVEFQRDAYEVKRNLQLGRRNVCSRVCNSTMIARTREKPAYPKGKQPTHLNSANRRDMYSPFRKHLRLARYHARLRGNQECTITLEDLKNQWERQQGVCTYTGWRLENPAVGTRTIEKIEVRPDKASLDRIDSTKGYVVENIHFVATIANFAKNVFTEKQLFEFCKAVVDFRHLK